MKLLDLYKAILTAVGAVIDDDGLISMTRPGDDPVPFMVDEKRLAIPTNQLLDKGAFNPDGQLIAFHPICENVVLETSPVLAKLEAAMAFRLTWVMRELIMQLVSIAANPKIHKKMKVKEHALLSVLADADERTRNDFIKVMESTTVVGQKKLLSLYVRKGGIYCGDKVSKLARFFPSIVDSLDQEKRTLLGVSLRKADVPAFLALIEYILPDYRDPDKYVAPSNSMVAPSFHALVRVYAKVAQQLNRIIDVHAPQLNEVDSLKIDVDWVDSVQDLSPYRENIPVLPGNDGAEGTKTVKTPLVNKSVAGFTGQKDTSTGPRGNKLASVDDLVRALTPARQHFGAFQQLQQQNQRSTGRAGWATARASDNDLPPWARQQPTSGWGSSSNGSFRRSSGSRPSSL